MVTTVKKQRGCLIPQLDHRDRDFLKSFGFAGVKPVFPDEYNTDAGLWVPNQNEVNPEFPNTPAQPFGCTNFVTADLSADLDGVLKDPAVIELITHANERGGYDIRESLLVAKKLGWISGFYNIKAYAPLDYFDAIRYASMSGLPELRSVSIGTPWYPQWQISLMNGGVLMPRPLTLSPEGLPWHDWKIGGWKMMNGSPVLKGKPLEGKNIGDGGWIYFDRSTINAVMNLKYTVAFTATHMAPNSIQRIDMATYEKLKSYFRTLLGLRY